MKELTDGVWLLRGFPPNAINVFLLDDVLIDAATKFAGRRILRQIKDRPLSAHALTHAHPDHQGASKQVCETRNVPLWVGEGDVHAMETAGAISAAQPPHRLNGLIDKVWTGPPHPVDRALHEGDSVGSFEVLEVPGHSAGHVAYWRERDRVLVCGDVLNNMNLITALPGLHQPPTVFTPDPARNRESARRLGELRPALALFGHGPPLRDPGKFADFCAALAA
jgi:glyoxylase-like metal-dependent hydrolase (beta-lactamase superfamily II)